MLKIVVTGGAGYVGIKLCKALLDAGHRVIIADKFIFGYESVLHLVPNPRLEILQKDIRDEDHDYLSGADVVYHLAGLSGLAACEQNPNSAVLINHRATVDLVKALSPSQMLIYASTTSMYGSAEGKPCDETTPVTGDNSNYSRTKLLAEGACMEHPNAISLRLATIFGVSPKMRIDVLPNDFTYRAINDRCLVLFRPSSKRTFLHIDDAVRVYLICLDRAEEMVGQIFNVGHEKMNLSKLDIAEAIRRHVDFSIERASDMEDLDVRDFYIVFDKIKALGVQPTVSLEAGIAELVKLFRFYAPYSTVPRI